MSRSLHDDLSSLASLGAAAVDPDTSADRVLQTVQTRRRRRLAAAGIAASLVLGGAGVGASALVGRSDPAPLAAVPDALRVPSIRALCGAPAPDYLEATSSPSITYSFTADRPEAAADLDGEDLTAGTLEDRPFASAEPLPTLIVSTRGSDEERTVEGPTGFVVVRDGVVVATPPAMPSTWAGTRSEVDADSLTVLSTWGVQSCAAGGASGTGTLDPGTYTVYGITRVVDPAAPRTTSDGDATGLVVGPALTMTLADTSAGGVVRYFGDVQRSPLTGQSWSGGTWSPDQAPADAPPLDPAAAGLDWPADITLGLQSGTATAQSVVWFPPLVTFGSTTAYETSADAAVVEQAAGRTLEHIGYPATDHRLALACQPAAAEALAGVAPTDDPLLTFGYAVAFETPAEAAGFVDLFSETFGYTPAQVDGEATCS